MGRFDWSNKMMKNLAHRISDEIGVLNSVYYSAQLALLENDEENLG